jgi:HlyD family secretion protein
MKKKVFIAVAVIIFIAVAGLIIRARFSRKKAEVSFETVKVEKGQIASTVTATGTIEAIKTVNVGTQVSGIVQRLYADFNDNVKQGQLLARLDTTALRAQWDQNLALVRQAQAQLNYQENTFNRLKILFEKKLISKADYDQALFNFENSKAALSNSESALAWAKVNLDHATICSPIDGVVLNRAVEEGQTVAASFNTPTLFTIVQDLTRMEVQTSVDEADIGKVKDGQRVEFTVDAYPDDRFEASVSEVRLQPVINNNVVTYVVILNAPNPDKKLMPGMTATATIYVEEKANVLILSGKALRFRPDTSYINKMMIERENHLSGGDKNLNAVHSQMPSGESSGQAVLASSGTHNNLTAEKRGIVWVMDEQHGLRRNMVKVGIDNGTTVEILSGLNEGDKVIISMSNGDEESSSQDPDPVKDGPRIPNMGPGYGG